ncbi:MAG: hypothetical protein WD114_00685 [Phycisphaerales bacterium]
MTIRLGELLVLQGALSEAQRDEILGIQRETHRPFGVIAEELFGVAPSDIEQAWASQYAMIAPRIDPVTAEIGDSVLGLITKRQAWQFGLIPVADLGGEIQFVTSRESLARALRFVGWRMNELCTFAICDLATLKRGLDAHYPFEGVDMDMVDRLMQRKPAA